MHIIIKITYVIFRQEIIFFFKNRQYSIIFNNLIFNNLATDLKVDGGYGAMGPEGFGETSVFAGVDA